jgi:hypothetical protein
MSGLISVWIFNLYCCSKPQFAAVINNHCTHCTVFIIANSALGGTCDVSKYSTHINSYLENSYSCSLFWEPKLKSRGNEREISWIQNQIKVLRRCWMWYLQSGDCEEYGLLGCDAVYFGRSRLQVRLLLAGYLFGLLFEAKDVGSQLLPDYTGSQLEASTLQNQNRVCKSINPFTHYSLKGQDTACDALSRAPWPIHQHSLVSYLR